MFDLFEELTNDLYEELYFSHYDPDWTGSCVRCYEDHDKWNSVECELNEGHPACEMLGLFIPESKEDNKAWSTPWEEDKARHMIEQYLNGRK